MSYSISLLKDGKSVEVERHKEGGTYVMGGTIDAELSITYNYSEIYSLFDFTIRYVNGKTAKDVIDKMQEVVDKLGTDKYKRDYWAPTPGNAGYALLILLQWAKEYPDAVFNVS